MNISNSKKQLAKIIHENGGWRESAEFTAQDGDGTGSIDFFKSKPRLYRGDIFWKGDYDCDNRIERTGVTIKNWHQTILSRDEYFHLYPAPDADGWIEWKGGIESPVGNGVLVDVIRRNGLIYEAVLLDDECWSDRGGGANIIAYRLHKHEKSLGELCCEVKEENKHEHIDAKPTIEQLATDFRNLKDFADRKQEEAKAAKADAKAKLAKLVAAGKALGLALSVAGAESEPDLVITDWRDLRVGDVIELTGSKNPCWKEHFRSEMTVREVYQDQGDLNNQVDLIGESGCWSLGGNTTWRFIRRP